MYSYPWLAEIIHFFFLGGWGLPGVAGSWGLESSLGVEIQPWGLNPAWGLKFISRGFAGLAPLGLARATETPTFRHRQGFAIA